MSQSSYPPPGYGPPPVYGPPPGGRPPSYGPPPPYGAPPPYGTPPPPPKKSGPSVGLLVGIGCGVVAVLVLGLGALLGVGYYVAQKAERAAPVASRAEGEEPAPVAPRPLPAAPKAELRDVRTWRSETVGFRHFIGEIVNVGAQPIGSPHAKITLLDGSGTAIESGSCYTLVRVLDPGSRVPCSVVVTAKVDRYASWRAEISALPVTGTEQPADLRTADVKFTPKKGYSPASLDGKITNGSAFRARQVAAVVSMYGADGKIVAAQNALVAGTDLDAGGSALFSAKIFDFAAPPETYRVRAVGYE